MKHLPEKERPRERILYGGAESLSTAELLAVVLRSGSERQGVLAQAQAVLDRAEQSLRRLANLGQGELCELPGIGPTKAAQIIAIMELARRFGQEKFSEGSTFRGSRAIYEHFKDRLAEETHEQFYAVLLDNRHRKIRDVRISQGTLTNTMVHPREVFLPVIRDAAAAVIFVHNHPTGDPTPSSDDLRLTQRLREVGSLIGIRVLDHIVIGKGRYCSFVDDGYW